jgi:heat shock protein HslJ
MRRFLIAVALTATLAAAAGCAGQRPSISGGDPASGWPIGRTFLSTAVTENGQDHPLVAGTRISIDIFSATELHVQAGCNAIGVKGALDGQRFKATQFGSTAMGCDQPRLAQDNWVIAFFTAGTTWQLTGDQLVLTAGANVITLLDRRVVDPDRPIIGTHWVVTGSFDQQTASSAPDAQASVQFAADGTVTATTGCATLTGPATVAGATITFGALQRGSVQACEALATTLDAAMVRVLQGKVTAAVNASRLTLTAADGHGLTLNVTS